MANNQSTSNQDMDDEMHDASCPPPPVQYGEPGYAPLLTHGTYGPGYNSYGQPMAFGAMGPAYAPSSYHGPAYALPRTVEPSFHSFPQYGELSFPPLAPYRENPLVGSPVDPQRSTAGEGASGRPRLRENACCSRISRQDEDEIACLHNILT